MTDVIKTTQYDERDPKFIKIREEFSQELKKNFSCDNYEEIIKYVFEEVFKNKLQKSVCIAEFETLFAEKTEELVNMLFRLAEQNLKETDSKFDNDKDKDVLEKILSNEPRNKPYQKTEYKYQKKNLERKKSKDFYNQGKSNDKERNAHHNSIRKGIFRNNKIKVGSKEVILHNISRKRSRSRSNSNDNKNERLQKNYLSQEDYQNYLDSNFSNRGFYQPTQRGIFQSQMIRSGRFPFFQPMMGFVDLRR